MWVVTLKAIYYPTGDFWTAGQGRNTSWVWKNLLHGRNLIKTDGRWSLGAGNNVDIVNDLWLFNGAKATSIPIATAKTVNDLMDSSRKWDLAKLRANLDPPSAIAAVKTPISWSASSDNISWPYSTDGSYSVK